VKEQPFRLAGYRAAAIVALMLLSGCAEFMAAREQRAQGWRDARIVQIDTGASIARTSDRDCRKLVPADEAAKSQYAVYEYRGVSRSRWYFIAPLPNRGEFKVGDVARVNIEGCSLARK
jgi:hypothetical protein